MLSASLLASGASVSPSTGETITTHDVMPATSFSASSSAPVIQAASGRPAADDPAASTARMLAFEENRGQFDDEVAFAARRGQAAVSLTRSAEMLMGLPDGASVTMRLVGGADQPAVAGRDRAAGQTNYLRGDPDEWVRGVGSYREVVYEQVHAGIDLVVQASEDGWPRYDFQLEPGADPSAIRLGFDGADGLAVDDDGDLRLDAAGGEIVQRRPFAYQDVDGERREVAAEFTVVDETTVAFELGPYDATRQLVIDPEVEFSTYVGGVREDQVTAVAADGEGNSYAVGWTESINVPTTEDAYREEKPGEDSDNAGFVVKYGPEGQIVYATYFDDLPRAVAVDDTGRAHLTGRASEGFPATEGAYRSQPSDGPNAFVARLGAEGDELDYGTYLGSAGTGRAIAVDGHGHVTVAGITESDSFRVTADAYQGDRGGGDDVFVAVLNLDTEPESALRYATYLGGSGDEGEDDRVGMDVDAHGRVYVGGTTQSGDLPTTSDAYQGNNPDPDCGEDGSTCTASAFAAVLDPQQAGDDSLVYATYLGGDDEDKAWDVGVADGDESAAGSLVVAGTTASCDFSTSDGAYRTDPRPDILPGTCLEDVFVARIDIPPPGATPTSELAYATLLGADVSSRIIIAADSAGRAHVTGATSSDAYPVTDDAPQKARASDSEFIPDAFLTRLTPDGAELEFSTYRGGSHTDHGQALAIAPDGTVVVGGHTASRDFPVTEDAAQADYPGQGRRAGWVTRFSVVHPLAPRLDAITPDQGPTVGGTTMTITGHQLGDVTQVHFGATAVPCPSGRCERDSDQQLTVTTPPHPQGKDQAGEVAVTAVNDYGRSPSLDFLFSEGIWEETTPLHAARFGHRATVLPDGTVLVAGCQLPDLQLEFPVGECPGHSEVYDPLQRDWAAVGPGEPSGPAVLLKDGEVSECGVNCGKVLVVACPMDQGVISHACSGHGGLYNPTASAWEPAAPPTKPRGVPAAARLADGRVLTTGDDTTGCSTGDSSSELFDARTGAWTPAAPLQHSRDHFHTLTALPDGTALAVGGITSDSCPTRTPERFYPDADDDDPREGVWRETADQGQWRATGFTATLLTGGAAGRCGHDCGKVMIAGGDASSAFDYTGEVELYDADADAWTPTAPLPEAVHAHTATELATGKILAAGGQRQGGDVPNAAAAHVYDPILRRWEAAGRMDSARGSIRDFTPTKAQHTATVISSDAYGFGANPAVCGLDCGKVLVVGGSGDASAELYTPAPVVTSINPGEAEAAGGTTVTIEGAGFTHGVREVRFGGQSVECRAPEDSDGLPQTDGACRVIDYFTLEVEVPPAAEALSVPVEVIADSGYAAAEQELVYTGAPGRVDDLAAEATSASQVTLSWSAVGQTGQFEPPADEYVVVHSGEPIGDADDFDSASVLCGGVCDAFDPSPAAVGDALELTVGGLAADTTHHFAVAALDPDGRRGPVSDSVSATTLAGDGDGELPGFDDDGGGDGGDGDGGDAPVAPLEGGVLRLAGADRIATAVAASQEAFADDEAGAVVMARADVFADGLAGVPLAAAENAPLLLTGSGELDLRSQAELERVLADGGEVFLLGGTAALSDAVEQQVAALGYAPTRLAGADRFATAVAIAEDGLGAPDRVLVTTGGGFADAVTAGAAGARHGAAVVLTAGDQLPAATADYLARHQPGEQIAVGGPAARAVPDMAALVGTTRFETAATVADALFAEPATVGVATGLRFPDALSGGAHIARYQGPMLLSGPDRLHPAAAGYLASRRAHLQSGVIYGGTAALSPAVEDQLADALP